MSKRQFDLSGIYKSIEEATNLKISVPEKALVSALYDYMYKEIELLQDRINEMEESLYPVE